MQYTQYRSLGIGPMLSVVTCFDLGHEECGASMGTVSLVSWPALFPIGCMKERQATKNGVGLGTRLGHSLILRIHRPPQARQRLPVREVGTADTAPASCRVQHVYIYPGGSKPTESEGKA